MWLTRYRERRNRRLSPSTPSACTLRSIGTSTFAVGVGSTRDVKHCLLRPGDNRAAHIIRVRPAEGGPMNKAVGVVCTGLAIVGAAAFVAFTQTGAGAQNARLEVPQFEPDPLWSEALPNKWVTGQVGGLAVDTHDNLWVFHRPATI